MSTDLAEIFYGLAAAVGWWAEKFETGGNWRGDGIGWKAEKFEVEGKRGLADFL